MSVDPASLRLTLKTRPQSGQVIVLAGIVLVFARREESTGTHTNFRKNGIPRPGETQVDPQVRSSTSVGAFEKTKKKIKHPVPIEPSQESVSPSWAFHCRGRRTQDPPLLHSSEWLIGLAWNRGLFAQRLSGEVTMTAVPWQRTQGPRRF
jgi:hypothetical protein